MRHLTRRPTATPGHARRRHREAFGQVNANDVGASAAGGELTQGFGNARDRSVIVVLEGSAISPPISLTDANLLAAGQCWHPDEVSNALSGTQLPRPPTTGRYEVSLPAVLLEDGGHSGFWDCPVSVAPSW